MATFAGRAAVALVSVPVRGVVAQRHPLAPVAVTPPPPTSGTTYRRGR